MYCTYVSAALLMWLPLPTPICPVLETTDSSFSIWLPKISMHFKKNDSLIAYKYAIAENSLPISDLYF